MIEGKEIWFSVRGGADRGRIDRIFSSYLNESKFQGRYREVLKDITWILRYDIQSFIEKESGGSETDNENGGNFAFKKVEKKMKQTGRKKKWDFLLVDRGSNSAIRLRSGER